MDPSDRLVRYLFGQIIYDNFEFEQAAIHLNATLEALPDDVPCRHTLAITYTCMNELDRAIREFDRCLEIDPENLAIGVDRSLAILLKGDLVEGFKAFECRRGWSPKDYPSLGVTAWSGDLLEGKSIYVYAEQGIGDTIMFSRYLPWLSMLSKKVIFSVQKDLMPIFAEWPKEILHRIDCREDLKSKVDADFSVPLCSLAHLAGTSRLSIPKDPGWLREMADRMKVTFPLPPDGVKRIGIVWSGNPTHWRDRERTIALERLLRLADNPAIQLYSLQVGQRQGDIEMVGAHPLVFDLGPHLTEWRVTAGALTQLDALVTVDTGIAHLSAAIGVPTFILVGAVPDWRWTFWGKTSPWYPSVRLFRQETPGDWTVPLEALEAWLKMWKPERMR